MAKTLLKDKISDFRNWQQQQEQELLEKYPENGVSLEEFNPFEEDSDDGEFYELDDANHEQNRLLQTIPELEEANPSHSYNTVNRSSNTPKKAVDMDVENSPVNPGIDGVVIKTFDDLINNKIGSTSQDHPKNVAPVIPKPFLKKGSGLQRYRLQPDKKVSRRCCSRSKDSSTALQSDLKKSKHRVDVTRSTKRGNFSAPPKPHKNSNIQTINTLKPATKPKKPEWMNSVSAPGKPVVREYSKHVENNIVVSQDFNPMKDECVDQADSSEESELCDLKDLLQLLKVKQKVLLVKNSGSDHVTSDVTTDPMTTKSVNSSGTFSIKSKESEDTKVAKPTESPHSVLLKKEITSLEGQLRKLQKTQTECNTERQKQPQNVAVENLNVELSDIKKKIDFLVERVQSMELHHFGDVRKTVKGKTTKGKVPAHFVRHEPQTKGVKVIEYDNGDEVLISADSTTVCKYRASGVKQTIYQDGTKVIEFPTGQVEMLHKSGMKTINYPDGSKRVINVDGSEELLTSDGTTIQTSKDGTEVIELPNGEREIRTTRFKRREYRNGTTKVVYADGTQETRYPNGRLRIKDSAGNIMIDSFIHLSIA